MLTTRGHLPLKRFLWSDGMKIYIDENYKCHVSNPDGIYTEIDTPKQFNGKCTAYIEGYRVRPEGYTYIREDGFVFGPEGTSVSPWRDLALLQEFQTQYEQQLAETEAIKTENAEYEAALSEIEQALEMDKQ